MKSFMMVAGFLMFLNVTLLTILVPGGPIENRDFSHLKGLVFWGFNVFLISLGLTSYLTGYLLLTENQYALIAAQVIAVLYFGVYLIDLAGIFPKSPTKMSKPLMLLELVNASLAIFLFIFTTAIGKSL